MRKKVLFLLLVIMLIVMISGCNGNKTLIRNEYIIDSDTVLNDNREAIVNPEDQEKWEEIETFLGLIVQKEIKTIKTFYLYGSEPGYEKVPASNYGYLPFYSNEDLGIIDGIVPLSNTYIRPGKKRTSTKYVVIHNTGMASPVMTAARMSQSINNSTRQASWHFTVDDNEIYQQLLLDEIGWHAGTPEGNNYGIAIEMAVYQGIDLNMAMRRTAKLTAWLMLQYNLELKDVKRHFDFSGKNCPEVLLEGKRWEEFLDLVEIEYQGQKNFSDVKFEWESLSVDIMNDEGKVISTAGTAANVKYRVRVTYNNTTRTYEFASNLAAMI